MTQQINLVNPALRKKREWVTARNIVMACAMAVAVLLLLLVLIERQADQLMNEARAAEDALQSEQARLAAFKQQLAALQPDARLAQELAQAEQMLAQRKEIVATLKGGAIGKTEGFSEYMRAFARQSVNGLWLTGFSISAGGNELEINGRTLSPESVPSYIRRLNGEKVVSGRSFAALDMRSVAEDPTAKPAADAGAKPNAEPAKQAARFIEFSLMSSEPAAERKP